MPAIYIIAAILLVAAAICFYVIHHPQIIVGKIQKALYKGKPINSYSSFAEPANRIKENGSRYVTEIAYGREYPNSYLDITYPTEDITLNRPTVVYFHGGGYFGGDKSMGDPMAADDDANRLFDEIVANGYNFVNVNYALVPEYRFPVPLIQMNQAINFLAENSNKYGLNMKKIIVFGQSAGAIMAAQYGALLSNPEYQMQMGIYPAISTEDVKALIIDDAPLLTETFKLRLKLIIANYLSTNNMKSDIAKQYNAYRHVNENFPPCFMTAGNTDGFPEDMQALADKLQELGVENEYYRIRSDVCELPHGYLNLVKENKYARECFNRILNFMAKHSK